ncbi:hypothetical protein AB0K89_11455 [Streptomyces cinnamoneus]|uniref:hypothetical protein n=1 Tax=Streptomyces cinnamoneus TaxID=53446 RepID=UPI0034392E7D
MGQEDEDDIFFPPPEDPTVLLAAGDRAHSFIYAPNGNINTGSVDGGQCVGNGPLSGHHGYRVEVREGPISEQEITDAQSGFVEPDWFPAATAELGKGMCFLIGQPGTGRRTAALNLLRHQTPPGSTLWAIDGDTDLSSWRPGRAEAGGYLLDGLLSRHTLKPGVLRHLRQLLSEREACLVIVTQDDPGFVHVLERHLHVKPLSCVPPPPKAVFEAHLMIAIPDPVERERLLGSLGGDLLGELLTPELVPAEVVELVNALTARTEEPVHLSHLRDRLSFLAEGEVPQLIKKLRNDPDALAFLLAACVFEGLDYRIVQEEADRLLTVADGALHAVLDVPESAGVSHEQPRPHPRFVFRRSLSELLHTVGALRAPKEVWASTSHPFVAEPVLFVRHRQAVTVLRHVWREYGGLPTVLTQWMDNVRGETELTAAVGRVVGMAAGWGGGRRALRHIGVLARSDHNSSRTIAAYALGVASEDPVLAGEVKYRLDQWSWSTSPQLRCTVAHTCGTVFGLSRPDLAMELLHRVSRGPEGEQSLTVHRAVRASLVSLFVWGNQPTVLRHFTAWSRHDGADTELTLRLFPHLLVDAPWFQQQLLTGGEFARPVVELIHRTLNHVGIFDMVCHHLLRWCRLAAGSDSQQEAVNILLTELARDMQHGVLRLFVAIDRDDDPDLAGREIARRSLGAWRHGKPPATCASDRGPLAEQETQ